MKIIWSSTNPGIQAPIWIASDSCRDLSVLLPFNSSWISDRDTLGVCQDKMSWLFNRSPPSSVCLFHMIKLNIFVKLSLSKAANSKSTFPPGLSQLLTVHGSHAMKCSNQEDRSEPVLTVQGPGLVCDTDEAPCCWGAHCQAQAALCCEGHQQYPAGTDSTCRITPAEHQASPCPDSHCTLLQQGWCF